MVRDGRGGENEGVVAELGWGGYRWTRAGGRAGSWRRWYSGIAGVARMGALLAKRTMAGRRSSDRMITVDARRALRRRSLLAIGRTCDIVGVANDGR